jgi:hypothetical protein
VETDPSEVTVTLPAGATAFARANAGPTEVFPTHPGPDAGPTEVFPTHPGPDAGPTEVLPTHPGPDAGRGPARDAAGRPPYGSFGTAARPGTPESELPTQMIAPLPFGGPSTEQPARAFRAQPPTGLPPRLPVDRPRPRRRGRTLAALLIAVGLVVAVVLGAVLLVDGLRRDGRTPTGGGDPGGATSSAPPAAIPPGYGRYEGAGFSVAVPRGWPSSSQREGVVDIKEPNATRFLRLITVDSTASALEQLTTAERQFAADDSYGAYRRVRLEKVDYRGLDAADWEFTFTLNGVPRHVVYRGIVTGDRTYGLYLSTPESQWATSRAVFQTAADTFRTT